MVIPAADAAVDVVEEAGDAAGVAAAALEVEPELLPHPATAIAEIASARSPATRNFAVLKVTIIAPGLVARTRQIGAGYL
jgi:hypothetical protein